MQKSWIEEFGLVTEQTGLDEEPGSFPTFDQFIETCRDGWGPSGSCRLCGQHADRLSRAAGYCFACEKYDYGIERGEYKALVRLGQHLRYAFMPMISWWPGQWPPKGERGEDRQPRPWTPSWSGVDR